MSNEFKIKFKTENTFTSKTIPLTVDGVSQGNITIRRYNDTGRMEITPYIFPVAPNLSNVYIFEKNVSSVDQNKFVTLIDVFIDTKDYVLPSGMTVDQFIAAGEPSNISDPSYCEDLHRWKLHLDREIFTRYLGGAITSSNEFASIKSARMFSWTGTFTCQVMPEPVEVLIPVEV